MVKNLLIDFHDTNSVVEVPLGENVVLFGENGLGKTRVLKIIDSIIKMSNTNSSMREQSILRSLNIKSFELNGIGYEELFTEQRLLISNERKGFIEYFNEHKNIMELYVELKLDFLDTGIVSDNFSNVDVRRCREALNYFYNSDFPNNFRPNVIRKWEADANRISIETIKDIEFLQSYSLLNELYELEKIVKQIINGYLHNVKFTQGSAMIKEFELEKNN